MAIRVFVTGGTGWAGSALCKSIVVRSDMELTGVLSRQQAGKNFSELLGLPGTHIPVFGNINEALSKTQVDVMVEYTKPTIAKANILTALEKGIRVVVGTSGLTDNDYKEIEAKAIANKASVLAVGNFAITAVLQQKFSELAARYIPDFEVIDYAHETKIDAPSGTARELAYQLSLVRESTIHISPEKLVGSKESRGVRLNGVQVHSVRLPGHVISVESIFGMHDERLTIRHDAGSGPEAYVQGALLAIQKVNSFTGMRRGLASVMEF